MLKICGWMAERSKAPASGLRGFVARKAGIAGLSRGVGSNPTPFKLFFFCKSVIHIVAVEAVLTISRFYLFGILA